MSENSSQTWVGWQGVIAEVPEDWSLAAVSGSAKSGYFRADSADSLMLEVKWSQAGKQVDLYSHIDNYLRDLRRKARKRKVNFEHKIKHQSDGEYTFSWWSDRKARGRMWRCDECDKIVIAQVSGGASDKVSSAASRVLQSIEDHSDDGWLNWAMYDLVAQSPPGYVLEKQKLMSGYLKLEFRKGVNRLIIERWGLANVALKQDSLRDWFEARSKYELRPYRYTIEDIEFEDGEVGLQATGRRWGVAAIVKSAVELLTLRKPASRYDAYVWVCDESNKIFSVQTIHSPKEDILDETLERVICH